MKKNNPRSGLVGNIDCFVFWQQFVSMHQIDLLIHIAKECPVKLIVDYEYDISRTKMGWLQSNNELLGIEVIVSPSTEFINRLFTDFICVHIFSGFSRGNCISRGLATARKTGSAFFIMAEAPDFFKAPFLYSFFRFLKYYIFYLKYRRYIRGVLAIGSLGLKFYKLMPIKTKLIFQFGYFVDPATNTGSSLDHSATFENSKICFIFVGRLVHYKGIKVFLEGIDLLPGSTKNNLRVEIYGEGVLKSRLIDFICRNDLTDLIFMHSFYDNMHIRKKIKNSDVLCLTNTSDEGWGVVVNEAILEGTFVLCSKYTGSSILIDASGGLVGEKMEEISPDSIRNAVETIYSRLTTLRTTREIRQKWSTKITAKSGADYLISIVSYLMNVGEKPKAPWEKQ